MSRAAMVWLCLVSSMATSFSVTATDDRCRSGCGVRYDAAGAMAPLGIRDAEPIVASESHDCASSTGCRVELQPVKTTTGNSILGSLPVVATELIFNPGFESGGDGWVQVPSNIIVPASTAGITARTGGNVAWLGGYNNANDLLYQPVAIPADATSVVFSFWFQIRSDEVTLGDFDRMIVSVDSTAGTTLGSVLTLSNQNATTSAWRQSPSFDLSAFRGQTIRIAFRATSDASLATNFFVDDISVMSDVAPINYPLAIAVVGSGGGVVVSSPSGINCGAVCGASFSSGSLVTLTATPTVGSSFAGWSGACSGTGSCQVTMSAARSVTATFNSTLVSYPLSVAVAGASGAVSSSPAGINCGSTCTANFEAGSLVSLTATPSAGANFAGWSGACTGSGVCQVPMNGPKSVTATFFRSYSLSIVLIGNGVGTVLSSPSGISCGAVCNAEFPSNFVVTLTATPSAGSRFTGWGGACSGIGGCSVTMSASKQVFAAFDVAGSINPTGFWSGVGESGWGLNFNLQGDSLLGAVYTYDTDGSPLWLVLSVGSRSGNSYTGPLYRSTGPVFSASPWVWNPAANLQQVGTMTVNFTSSNAGTLSYSVNGVTVNKSISKFSFGSPVTTCTQTAGSRAGLTNYQDVWESAPAGSEPGWGLAVAQEGGVVSAGLYKYGTDGKTLWLLMGRGERQADGSYVGDLLSLRGPAFNTFPWPNNAVTPTTVGTMRLRFTNGEAGTLSYTMNGVTVNKNITRNVFGSTRPVCQ